MNDTGEALRLLRTSLGLTTTEVALLVDTTQATISRVETGNRNPSQRLLRRWLDVFGFDMEEFKTM